VAHVQARYEAGRKNAAGVHLSKMYTNLDNEIAYGLLGGVIAVITLALAVLLGSWVWSYLYEV